MRWQPIDTAPKDGSLVALRRVYQRAIIAERHGFFGCVTIAYDDGPETICGVWVDEDKTHLFPAPTHWKPAEAQDDTARQE